MAEAQYKLDSTRRTGITSLEIVMATLITGVMLVVSLEGVRMVFQTDQLNAERLQGPGLAQELMTEILSMPYKEPDDTSTTIGVDAGESAASRADYDDVDDYDGLNVLGIKAKDGTARTGFSDWRQQTSVDWIEVTTGLPWILGDTGLKRITVTITAPDGDVTQLRAYRFEKGMLERSPMLDTDAVTWVGAELKLGAGLTARMGTNLPNHTPDAN